MWQIIPAAISALGSAIGIGASSGRTAMIQIAGEAGFQAALKEFETLSALQMTRNMEFRNLVTVLNSIKKVTEERV